MENSNVCYKNWYAITKKSLSINLIQCTTNWNWPQSLSIYKLSFSMVPIQVLNLKANSARDTLCKSPIPETFLAASNTFGISPPPFFSCLTWAETQPPHQNVKSLVFNIMNVFEDSLCFSSQAHIWTLPHPHLFSTNGAQWLSEAQGQSENACFMLFGDLKKKKLEVLLFVSNSKISKPE